MEIMVNVEFNLNNNMTIIQAKPDDPFQLIIELYIQKTSIEPNSFHFIANSKEIEPQQTVESYMSDIDKQNNKITVFVNYVNKEEYKNENKKIIKSKDIICPKCKEPCRFAIDNYTIKLYDCNFNHITNNIKFDEFSKTQEREMPDIVCDSCKNENKEYSNDNEIYECLTCKEYLCFHCKQNQHLNHNIIKYSQKKYICSKHNNIFIKFCEECHLNICTLCESEHAYHKTISFNNLKDDIEKSKNKLTEYRTVLDAFNKQIYEIIKKLNKVIEDMNTYYAIINNIYQSYDDKYINYQVLKNINEINTNNSIYEKIKNINEKTDIKQKIQDILDLYINFNGNDNELKKNIEEGEKESHIISKNDEIKLNRTTIIYNCEKEKKIQLFGYDFVENNKDNCYLIIDGEKKELCQYYQVPINEIQTLEVELIETRPITNMRYMFDSCKFLESLPDFPKWNVTNVTDMGSMFSYCTSLESLPDISNWNTRNVTNMNYLFNRCDSLISLPDISKWDTRNVTYMGGIFYGCYSLISLPDITKWNMKNVSSISSFFGACSSLKSLPDITKWDTKNIRDMSRLFCFTKFESLPDISKWDTKNVNTMSEMFRQCESLKSLPDISLWDTKNVTDISYMFNKCYSLNSLPDISLWDTKNVTNMGYLFSDCSSLNSLPDISKWDTRNVSDMSHLFYNCSSLTSFPDISVWVIKRKLKKDSMFQGVDKKIIPKKFKGCLIY